MLQALTIKNFRGIRELALEDFGRINIFVGANGVGKTTILEALALVTSPYPNALRSLAEARGLSLEDARAFTTLLHPSLSNPSAIQLSYISQEKKTYTLTIRPRTTLFINGTRRQEVIGGSYQLQSDDKSHQMLFPVPLGNQNDLIPPDYEVPSYTSAFLYGRTATDVAASADAITQMLGTQYYDLYLASLQSLLPSIQQVHVGYLAGVGPTILVEMLENEKASSVTLPIQALGDGINRLNLILLGAFLARSGILAVDEIDSGLHHSILNTTWEQFKHVLRESSLQVFCTTHSEEMLESTIEAFADDPDSLRIFRLEKRDDGMLHAVKITYDALVSTTRMGLEIR